MNLDVSDCHFVEDALRKLSLYRPDLMLDGQDDKEEREGFLTLYGRILKCHELVSAVNVHPNEHMVCLRKRRVWRAPPLREGSDQETAEDEPFDLLHDPIEAALMSFGARIRPRLPARLAPPPLHDEDLPHRRSNNSVLQNHIEIGSQQRVGITTMLRSALDGPMRIMSHSRASGDSEPPDRNSLLRGLSQSELEGVDFDFHFGDHDDGVEEEEEDDEEEDILQEDGESSIANEEEVDLICVQCGSTNAKWECSRCNIVAYCSVACQRQHWGAHRRVCEQSQFNGAASTDPPLTTLEVDVDASDIDSVIRLTECNRAEAIDALRNNDGDIVNAIMEITEC